MEKPLKCFPLLSLKEMALRRLAAILWNSSYSLALVMKFRENRYSVDGMSPLVDWIKDKIMKLQLPESLAKQVVDVARLIAEDIIRWKYFIERIFNISCAEIFEQDSAKLCFTTAGTVDERRTAQKIVHWDRINVVTRYKMACSYWLEDCIPILWKGLTEEDRHYFYKKNSFLRGLEFSWPRIFKRERSDLDSYFRKSDGKLNSFYQWAFEHSTKIRYKATAEHFFSKLSHEERKVSIKRSALAAAASNRDDLHDVPGRLRSVLSYLLSLMTPEQQVEIVKAQPLSILSCFLDWPRQDLFLENASLIWPFLPRSNYKYLLRLFYRCDLKYYPELFKQSPLDFKKYVAGPDPECLYFAVRFLRTFFDSEDSECIEMMFRAADTAARVELVSSSQVWIIFHNRMAKGKWRLVEVCLREATLSRKDRMKLKRTFLEYLNKGLLPRNFFDSSGRRMDVPEMFDGDPRLKNFFDFLDATDASAEGEKKGRKRKLEDCK